MPRFILLGVVPWEMSDDPNQFLHTILEPHSIALTTSAYYVKFPGVKTGRVVYAAEASLRFNFLVRLTF